MMRSIPLLMARAVFLCFAMAFPTAAQEAPLASDSLSGLKLRNIGPANMSGRFVDVAVVESDPFTFYAASATGGLFKTTNNGITFEPIFEREATHSIGAIAVFQPDPKIVWVGSGERANRQSSSWGDGVYKSTDAGKTWTNMGLRDSHHIGRIALHPTDRDVVYVAAMGHLWGPNEERGLYKSQDAGKSWKKLLAIDDVTGVVDVAIDPSDPNVLYAASYQRQRKPFGFHGGGPGSALHKSTDGGVTWKRLTRGLPEGEYGRIGISIYRKDPRIVYVCIEQGLRYTASTTYEERKAGIYRSQDKGESWQLMSNWNPRPMYASQILVDPSDDQRIYMENAFSYSDDGGKTFKVPRQSVHSDDRMVWVNPKDSRHLIKASDGALAISYDRGIKWLLVTSLPVSQYYRVDVDMQKPFWVYGGLQDNGSWGGPSATYRSEGILNEDWVRIGGGDGFINLADPTEEGAVYVESQYLGLTRVDMKTNEVRTLRPGDPHGYIESRRNWDVWGTGKPFPLLGDQMAPANWDAPFILSPHDPRTVYAGTNELWKSTDRGQSWTSLGTLTTDVVRSELTIMGQTPTASTPSLDDGIPFYPTLSALVESPLRQGLLYVGTDDGNLAVSRDGGKSWEQLAGRLPGAPPGLWIAGIEASRFDEGTVYVVVNNYRNDDYNNYLYQSTDHGKTWRSIVGDLPPRRVLRTLREDLKNPRLLYVGAELGFYLSIDGGRHWVELKNNLPTLAFNDFVIHPRDNDLVLGTHGRGIWILDNLATLQELTPEVLAAEAHFFTVEAAEMIRYAGLKAQPGDMIFRGENPPAGAILDYYLREPAGNDIRLTIFDEEGREVQKLEPAKARGINRVVWNLRHPRLPDPLGLEPSPESERTPRGPEGAFVVPGSYRARLTVRGKSYDQVVEVSEDPRIQVGRAERETWTRTLLELAELYREGNSMVEKVLNLEKTLGESDRARKNEAGAIKKLVLEHRRRTQELYNDMRQWTGAPTADQAGRLDYLRRVLVEELRPRVGRETGM
jgi:photosystem II stability/assembly factor-like uncharacterized protein